MFLIPKCKSVSRMQTAFCSYQERDVYKRQLLNTLIEKITVHEAVKGEDGSREQEVEIYYRFIGKID